MKNIITFIKIEVIIVGILSLGSLLNPTIAKEYFSNFFLINGLFTLSCYPFFFPFLREVENDEN